MPEDLLEVVQLGLTEPRLSLIVRTHNGSGVAKNSPLCLNYGLNFDLEAAKAQQAVETDSRVKRFRGALDAVLAKGAQALQGPTTQASEAVPVPAKTAAALAPLPAPGLKPPTPPTPTPPTATPAPPPKAPEQAALTAPSATQPTPQNTTAPDGEKMSADETVLATGVTNHNVTFSVNLGAKQFVLSLPDTQNRKIPPRTA